MNTMPQVFDARPLPQAGFSVSRATPPAPRPEPKPTPRLTLVVDQTQATPDTGASLSATQPAARPYGLNGRRHLAGVPTPPASAQAHVGPADNTGMAFPWPRQRLEPLAFALVLLVSVAALAVATRVG